MLQEVQEIKTDTVLVKTRNDLIVEILKHRKRVSKNQNSFGFKKALAGIRELDKLSHSDLFNQWFKTVKHFKLIRASFPNSSLSADESLGKFRVVLRKEEKAKRKGRRATSRLR